VNGKPRNFDIVVLAKILIELLRNILLLALKLENIKAYLESRVVNLTLG